MPDVADLDFSVIPHDNFASRSRRLSGDREWRYSRRNP